ncbi:MAG: ABC transporter permease [Firmicutes bacterium HGW-Firmicutes-9]|jgi:ABC-2 type transport system permease protein|nr:MAG: ABC transporter permease [Firmicutes bacterium HGW-Firmicutes-9]
MRQLLLLLRKELLELVRTKRAMVLLIVFGIFGILNPALAKLTPWMLSLMGESLAEQGITFGAITVDALTSWTQYFKNLMMEYILILAMFSSIFAQEYQSGTLVNLLTKGVSRGKVALSKLLAVQLTWTVCYWLTFLVTLGYTAYFWENALPAGIWLAAVCAYMMGVWLLSLELAFASALNSGMYALLLTGGVFALFFALGMLPQLTRFLPSHLGDGLGLLTGDMASSDILPALWVSLALSATQSALCVVGIRKKQL